MAIPQSASLYFVSDDESCKYWSDSRKNCWAMGWEDGEIAQHLTPPLCVQNVRRSIHILKLQHRSEDLISDIKFVLELAKFGRNSEFSSAEAMMLANSLHLFLSKVIRNNGQGFLRFYSVWRQTTTKARNLYLRKFCWTFN